MLLFKKKFLEQIRSGKKTQTIRLWKDRRMEPGQRSYIRGVGYIAIDSVEPGDVSRLTDADAVLDGFLSAELLRKEIRTLYTLEDRKKLTPFRVRFSVFPPREQQKFIKELQKQKRQQNRDVQQQEFVTQARDKLLKMTKSDGHKG
jgi:hypothetical protein